MFNKAFEAFMENQAEVEAAIDWATSQSWGGESRVQLELFKDGTCRVVPSVGNLYNTPGLLVHVPELSEDEYNEVDDEGNETAPAFYDNAIEALQRNFEMAQE